MVHYLLSWGDPHERLFDVDLTFTAPADAPRLLLPAWRPGRYLIQDYAANVREWSPSMRKDGKTSWRVDAKAGDQVRVRYRYYAGVLDAGSSFLDTDEAYFNGSNLFMLVEGLRESEHRLTVAAPAAWRIETQLPKDGETFVARDYDHLIDSPFICAERMTRHSFVEAGARIHLVFRGDDGLDTEQYVDPIRAIVRTQAELFGEVPFAEYRFLYHVADRWHGVEHEDSTSILLRRPALLGAGPEDDGYDHVLSISSHELFHAWNVKRMLPAVFAPYDYWRETPTRLLWLMEGVTSYYGDLTIARAGLWTPDHYLMHLGREIETLENLPGRHHLSLSQASFDAWLHDPAHMHDHPNVWISFYNKGEVVSALLDLTIRLATNGERSFDDVLRLLWNGPRALAEDAVEAATAEVADVGDFFARYVHGTEPLPYAELFAAAGIAFESTRSDRLALGARLRDGAVVDSVLRGGAAMAAGLLPGDELLAIDGNRTPAAAAVDAVMNGLTAGEPAPLLIARAGVVRTLTLTPARDPHVSIRLRALEPSELRRQWLGRE
jgi:predicted metalloprotease with PDZ domain